MYARSTIVTEPSRASFVGVIARMWPHRIPPTRAVASTVVCPRYIIAKARALKSVKKVMDSASLYLPTLGISRLSARAYTVASYIDGKEMTYFLGEAR